MTASPKLAGVVGTPIGHSLSPLIHTIWAARENANAYYVPVEVEDDDDAFDKSMRSLSVIGFAGVNVTIPHKARALKFATTASPAAKRAGAANMLTFSPEGAHAENSDIVGFRTALENELNTSDEKKTALVLGAGGAARGVVIAIEEAGFEKIIVVNRTRARAEDLVVSIGGAFVEDWDRRSEIAENAALVVNTTSLGMTGEPALSFDVENLAPTAIVADIVYAPLETELLRAARQKGLRVIDGLSMLMHQAAPGFRAWLGSAPEVDDELRAALVDALERKKP